MSLFFNNNQWLIWTMYHDFILIGSFVCSSHTFLGMFYVKGEGVDLLLPSSCFITMAVSHTTKWLGIKSVLFCELQRVKSTLLRMPLMVCCAATIFDLSEHSQVKFLLELLLCVSWVLPGGNNKGLSSSLHLSSYIASLPFLYLHQFSS